MIAVATAFALSLVTLGGPLATPASATGIALCTGTPGCPFDEDIGVMSNVAIHNLYMSNNWDAANPADLSAENIDQFTNDLVASDYFSFYAAQYHVTNVTFSGSSQNFGDCGLPTGSSFDYGALQGWINCEAHDVSPSGPTIWVVYAPVTQGYSDSVYFGTTCTNPSQTLAGFHSETFASFIPNPVLPQDFGFVSTECAVAHGGSEQDNTTWAASHEIIEGITDRVGGTGWVDWNAGGDPLSTGEAGDICEPGGIASESSPLARVGVGPTYAVSYYWSNQDNSCAPVGPVISAPVTPRSAPGGSSLTVTGTNLTRPAATVSATVAFDGLTERATSIRGTATRLSVGLPGFSGFVPASGYPATLTLCVDGLCAASGFTFTDELQLSSIAPITGPVAGGETLLLHGTGFDTSGGTQVTVNGVAVTPVTCTSSTQCTITVPRAASPGTVPVVVGVQCVAGTCLDSHSQSFTYQSPFSGLMWSYYGRVPGGDPMEIFGFGFDTGKGRTSASFSSFTGGFMSRLGGHEPRASSLACSSAETCTFSSPPSPLPGNGVGLADVTVKTGSSPSPACVGCYYYYLPDSPVLDTTQSCGTPAPVIAHVWDVKGNPEASKSIQYTFVYSNKKSSVLTETTDSEGVAAASPSKGKNYVAGSYTVSALNLSAKGSPADKLTVTKPAAACATLLSPSFHPLATTMGTGSLKPALDTCATCGVSQNEIDWGDQVGLDPFDSQQLQVLLAAVDTGAALNTAAVSVETTDQEVLTLLSHPEARIVPLTTAKVTGGVFVGPVADLSGNSGLSSLAGAANGDLRVELPYEQTAVPKGAHLVVVGLQTAGGKQVWSNVGVTTLAAGSGEVSADLPAFGQYTVMAITE